jgi:hypothetical protein
VSRIFWTQWTRRKGSAKYPIMSFILRAKNYYHDQINEDEMDRVWKLFEMHTKFLTEYLERRRPFERPNHRREGDIKTDVSEIGYECIDRTHMAQDGDSGRFF